MSSIECLPIVVGYNIGATSRLTRGSIRLRATLPAITDTHDCYPFRKHRSTIRTAYCFRLRRGGKSFKDWVLARSYAGSGPVTCADICNRSPRPEAALIYGKTGLR